jgi:hypothetical protein
MRMELIQNYVELRKQYYLVSNGVLDPPVQSSANKSPGIALQEYTLDAEKRLDSLKAKMSPDEQELANDQFLSWLKAYMFG